MIKEIMGPRAEPNVVTVNGHDAKLPSNHIFILIV